jgi:hypothetical protein
MFAQIFDRLDTWVGRSFLLASFFPFLIFIAANVAMLQFMVPDAAKRVESYFSGSIFGSINATGLGIAAVAALAYITDPLVGVMTKFLEGTYLPQRFAGWLASDQAKIADDLDHKTEDLGNKLADIKRDKDKILNELRTARDIGVAVGAMRNIDLITAPKTKIEELEQKRSRQQLIVVAELEKVAESLKSALKENCLDEDQLATDESEAFTKASRELSSLFVMMRRLIEYAENKASAERSEIIERRNRSFAAPHEMAATEFGNLAAALRGFCDKTFSFDFEFFWPVAQSVIQSDEKTTAALVNAKQKLDFCIRTLMFTIIFTALWLVVAPFTAESIYTVPTIGTAGFLAATVWLKFVHTNYASFAELVRSIIILKRFEVLKALHLDLPDKWADEKRTWEHVSRQLRWRSKIDPSEIDISYKHPDK